MTTDSAPSLAVSDPRRLVGLWFQEYQVPLYRYLVRLAGDEEQAADLLQETFARALIALQSQRLPDKPIAWLYRIATNLCYDHLRRQRRLRWLPFSGRETSSDFTGPLATAHAVRRCLGRLSRHEAEVLLLYEYVGLNCVEIAALSNEDSSAIRMRVHRARTRFRALYEKEVDS